MKCLRNQPKQREEIGKFKCVACGAVNKNREGLCKSIKIKAGSQQKNLNQMRNPPVKVG